PRLVPPAWPARRGRLPRARRPLPGRAPAGTRRPDPRTCAALPGLVLTPSENGPVAAPARGAPGRWVPDEPVDSGNSPTRLRGAPGPPKNSGTAEHRARTESLREAG